MFFGLYFIAYPDLTLFLLVRSFVFFAILDSLLGFLAALLIIKTGPWKALLITAGVVDLAAASVVLFLPVVSEFLIVLMIGPLIIVTGIAEIAGGLLLRSVLVGARWLMVGGMLSLAIGLILTVSKLTDPARIEQWIGAFMIVHGAMNIGLSFRLNFKK